MAKKKTAKPKARMAKAGLRTKKATARKSAPRSRSMAKSKKPNQGQSKAHSWAETDAQGQVVPGTQVDGTQAEYQERDKTKTWTKVDPATGQPKPDDETETDTGGEDAPESGGVDAPETDSTDEPV